MLSSTLRATFVPGVPGRASRMALWPVPGGDPVDLVTPAPQAVEARLVSVGELLDDIVSVGLDADATASLRAWAQVARVALGLIARGRLHPAVDRSGADTWMIAPLTERDRQVRTALAAWMPPEAHCVPVGDGTAVRMLSADDAVAGFFEAVADSLPRTAAAVDATGQRAWAGPDPVDVSELRDVVGTTEDRPETTVIGLRLELPADDADPFVVDLQLRSPSDPSRVAGAADLWAGTATGFDHRAEADLLLALRRGARLWPPLTRLLDEPEPSRMEVGDDEALALFGPLATDLAGAGIEVMIPAAMTRSLAAKAHVEPPPGVGDTPAAFDLSTVCQLTWRATLDGEPVSDADLSALAESRRPLVRMRGQWVVVDPTVVAKLARRDQMSAADALSAALGGTVVIDGEVAEVEVAGAVADLADRLRSAAQPHELAEPDGLEATLRPYQRRGVAWLTEMCGLGLGGVLADDMGLGKTIQLIALHLHLHRAELGADTIGPTLVVCPASIVGNWQRELARFAPGLAVHRYHGVDRTIAALGPSDVVVTTYGIARRDHETLATHPWGLLVADEAQQIKNPNSSTSRLMRRIPSAARIALTGTPVENRLTELWALLDWTTPGLLGTVEAFRRNVSIPVERDRDDDATQRFAHIVAPFLLRRRKDDPTVAPDLPPKTETDHPVALTPEQAGLYRATVEEILDGIEKATGIARRGLVLKLLTALKQICNHPAHFLAQPGPLAGRSGKLDAFDDLVGSITDAGDSVLVFTQYVAMGNLLMTRLAELGQPAEFLHGSLSLTRRSDMVDRFQAGGFKVFVISLKAGGTGLNLTRATHVIHYDRWWNPAVENQASDRAWRIGQDRPVQIHRLISEGTLEDRIAKVLADKQALADAVIGSGEAWLTELDDRQLAELVRLGSAD